MFPVGGGVVAGGVVTGAGAVVVSLGVGVGDEEGLDTGFEDSVGVGVTEERTLGSRLGVAVSDGRLDADGLASELGDDTGPETGLADASSLTCRLDTTSAFSSAGIHALSIDVACGA
jgi:hypothetical protein